MNTARSIVFATVAGVLVLLQFTLLSAALDFATSFILLCVGFLAGHTSKA